jgi:hypothetical protein
LVSPVDAEIRCGWSGLRDTQSRRAAPDLRNSLKGGSALCAWYLISGTARLRRCPEVIAILDELRDLRGDEFEVTTTAGGPGTIELTFRGGSEFPDEGADELDEMLRSLGPHAIEPTVFTGEYDGKRRVIPIDPADSSHPAPASIPILGTVR